MSESGTRPKDGRHGDLKEHLVNIHYFVSKGKVVCDFRGHVEKNQRQKHCINATEENGRLNRLVNHKRKVNFIIKRNFK